jgi:NAD dependent epimerase/dehydratase
MKILITGAGGFIGSHLTELLVNEGFDIRAFIRYNSKNNWGWLESSPVKNNIEIISGDIRDYDSVSNALKDCKAVFHLAALIGIPYSYVSPKAYIETNITGTYNILQASKDLGLEQVLITSTSETYGTAQYIPIDENHPMVGQSPYSASKISADQLAISFHRSFDLPVKIVRPFNTYGPRQSARAIIPTIISQIFAGNEKIAVGNVTPTRDLTFVKDTCRGFLEIFRSPKLYGEITNIGMGQEISVRDLINKICSLTQANISIQTDEMRIRPENSEVERLFCDNRKLIANSDWKPYYDLDMGLKETIDWVKNNLDKYKSEIYNV